MLVGKGKKEMKNFLCLIGIHRPLKVMDAYFMDQVSRLMVFEAECPCGKKFMTDNINGWKGCKVEMVKDKPGHFKGYKMP